MHGLDNCFPVHSLEQELGTPADPAMVGVLAVGGQVSHCPPGKAAMVRESLHLSVSSVGTRDIGSQTSTWHCTLGSGAGNWEVKAECKIMYCIIHPQTYPVTFDRKEPRQ